MARRLANLNLQHVRGIRSGQVHGHLTDRELLHRFARGDQSAFAALMRRHGAMVLGVGRRVLHQESDAEDVFQATFLALARHAGSRRWRASVGNWLYLVASRMALNARAESECRARHEAKARVPATADPLAVVSGRELCAVFDEEVARLPERLRAPLVACCLEGQTRDEAAKALGLSLGTLKRALEQGRALLRTRLEKRGFTLPAALAGALAAEGVSQAAIPAALTTAALSAAAGAPSSTRVLALAQHVLPTTIFPSLRAVAALLLTATLIGGLAWAVGRPLDPQSQETIQKPATESEPKTDAFGDPLPEGAIARMGTVRLRHESAQVAFAPDGKTLISWGGGLGVRTWDAATGKQIRERQLTHSHAKAMEVSLLDQKTVFTWQFGSLHLHDGTTGKEVHSLQVEPFEMPGSVCLSPDRKTVAVAVGPMQVFGKEARKKKVLLWDLASDGKSALPDSDDADALAFSPDSKFLVATCSNAVIRCWDVGSKTVALAIERSDYCAAKLLAFSPDGKRLASLSWAEKEELALELILWDIATGKSLASMEHEIEHNRTFRFESLVFSPSGRFVAAGDGQECYVWDTTQSTKLRQLKLGRCLSLAFSPDDSKLALSDGGSIHLWDLATGKPILDHLAGHNSVPNTLVSPDGKVLASSCAGEGVARLWDVANGNLLRVLPRHKDLAWPMAFSSDGKLLASLDGAGMLRLWEAFTGKKVRENRLEDYRKNGTPPSWYSLQFSADGTKLMILIPPTGEQDPCLLQVMETATGRLLQRREISAPYPAYLSSNAAYIAAEKKSGLTVLNSESGVPLLISREAKRFLAFSADSRMLAATSYGPSQLKWVDPYFLQPTEREWDAIHVYELASGKEMWQAKAGRNIRCSFSADGRLLASTDEKTLRIWDAATGKELFRRGRSDGYSGQRESSFTPSVQFLPNGRAVATGLRDGTIVIWDIAFALRTNPRRRRSRRSPDARRESGAETAGVISKVSDQARAGALVIASLQGRG
jgi:RNA polymerase sigma factor (sigma-70 family)